MASKFKIFRFSVLLISLILLLAGYIQKSADSVFIGLIMLAVFFFLLVLRTKARLFLRIKKRKIFLLIATLLFLCVFSEGIIRFSGLPGLPIMPSEMYSTDELKLRYPDFEKEGVRDNLNFSKTKIDVCVLGDSVTYGWCVRANDTWVSRLNLNKELNEQYLFHNLAYPGWSLKDYADFILENEMSKQLSCDTYIVLFWIEDFVEKTPDVASALAATRVKDFDCFGKINLFKLILKKSHFARFLFMNYAKIYTTMHHTKVIEEKFSTNEYVKDLNRLKVLNKSIVFFKIPFTAAKEFEMQFNPIIDDYMDKNNFSYFDMFDSIHTLKSDQIICSKTDLHYNEYGHELVAENAGKWLLNNENLVNTG